MAAAAPESPIFPFFIPLRKRPCLACPLVMSLIHCIGICKCFAWIAAPVAQIVVGEFICQKIWAQNTLIMTHFINRLGSVTTSC